ncbi:hypothetical protein LTR99_008051 [Exophiala xenobiotica]|uniref:Pyrroline-5-carboxylate reductase n=1 Tax=Vermiconidia calcicola TaxID=1690605 RepID=A0AAV9PQT3_9PEZI|nr:hypothetical protein LTR92_003684 [Exophiala xenobiotica]KAK5527828.1 hypothetical protein LTR25_010871 [Vermiconidia calcicola]KAK5544332.1 delta 1-pyrroline-5-carboxylate reductase [Chaetothyriales sp. CCFEE 6169]KAK5266054.1 hypothetical protein LTR96_008448 [Exophiala xenobiotica]KAK5297649.1 hypothetical protein LTR99_008051 [Exophiala xenobiotica]
MGVVQGGSGAVVAIIGCGNMGSSILQGIQKSKIEGNRCQSSDEVKVTKVLATTSTQASNERLRSAFSAMGQDLFVSCGSNVEVMREADVVVLGCKPHMIQGVLQGKGVREALKDKLVISILAGTPVDLLRQYLQGESAASREMIKNTCIVRAIPNIGAQVNASMTLVEETSMPESFAKVVSWIFGQVGRVKYVPPSQFEVATSLITASIAVTSVLVDGLLDGAVAEGLKRSEALEIAAQGLQATARLLLEERDCRPGTILERMCSPRGVTIQTVLTAEGGNLRKVGAEAVINGTQHLQKMSRSA